LAVRLGVKVVGQLCGAAEKISKRRASGKYNRKWKTAKFDGKGEEKHGGGGFCLLVSNIRVRATGTHAEVFSLMTSFTGRCQDILYTLRGEG